MIHILPSDLQWRAEYRSLAVVPQGGGHATGKEPRTVRKGPGSGGSETGTGSGSGTTDQKRQTGQGEDPCMGSMWMLLPMLLIFYFLLIRPQQKQDKAQKALVASITKGNRVVTSSGMHGTVVRVSDDTVVLKLDQEGKFKVTFDRTAVGRVVKDEPADDK